MPRRARPEYQMQINELDGAFHLLHQPAVRAAEKAAATGADQARSSFGLPITTKVVTDCTCGSTPSPSVCQRL